MEVFEEVDATSEMSASRCHWMACSQNLSVAQKEDGSTGSEAEARSRFWYASNPSPEGINGGSGSAGSRSHHHGNFKTSASQD